MPAVLSLAPLVGIVAACAALMLPRATFYRWQQPATTKAPRPSPPRALPPEERAEILATLNSDRFVDHAPRQVFAALLDEGRRLCSVRTMYRVLEGAGEIRERRDQLRHPTYVKPELLATAPNQVWSWDITKLKGPAKWTHFHLYVILDIFSRYIVGWMVAASESAALAQELIVEACARQGVQPGQLTIHADRGSPMKAKSTAMLYGDLGFGAPSHGPLPRCLRFVAGLTTGLTQDSLPARWLRFDRSGLSPAGSTLEFQGAIGASSPLEPDFPWRTTLFLLRAAGAEMSNAEGAMALGHRRSVILRAARALLECTRPSCGAIDHSWWLPAGSRPRRG
jgi:putative transposase